MGLALLVGPFALALLSCLLKFWLLPLFLCCLSAPSSVSCGLDPPGWVAMKDLGLFLDLFGTFVIFDVLVHFLAPEHFLYRDPLQNYVVRTSKSGLSGVDDVRHWRTNAARVTLANLSDLGLREFT
jgi:hypothetical protein